MSKERSHGPSRPLLGAHFSIAGGLHKALVTAHALQCTAAQIFTKNASTWKERHLVPEEIERFAQVRAAAGIGPVAGHTSYLINPASPDEKKNARSRVALKEEMLRSGQLKLTSVVLHPGAHMGAGTAAGIRRAAASINAVLAETPPSGPRLLLETTAGQGSCLGCRFEELASVLGRIDHSQRVGICLDTSHVFAAGYDLRTETAAEKTLAQFNRIVGLDRLELIHLNDSKKALGSKVDRHEHIGRGEIGLPAFRFFMNDSRVAMIPKILETPKESDGDRKNLDCLKALISRCSKTPPIEIADA